MGAFASTSKSTFLGQSRFASRTRASPLLCRRHSNNPPALGNGSDSQEQRRLRKLRFTPSRVWRSASNSNSIFYPPSRLLLARHVPTKPRFEFEPDFLTARGACACALRACGTRVRIRTRFSSHEAPCAPRRGGTRVRIRTRFSNREGASARESSERTPWVHEPREQRLPTGEMRPSRIGADEAPQIGGNSRSTLEMHALSAS